MTNENNFSGVCIGGPYDGQSYTHWSSQLVVREDGAGLPPAPKGFIPDPAALVMHSETVYDYVPLTHMQAVWVHETLREAGRGLSCVAFDRLAEAYVDAAAVRNQCKPK